MQCWKIYGLKQVYGLNFILQNFCLLTGHKDSVHCASFSYDSLLVATGDMKGVIKIWNAIAKTEVFSYVLPVEEAEDGDENEKEDLVVNTFCWL